MFNQWLIWQCEFWLTNQQKAYLSKMWEQRAYPGIISNDNFK
jgi:hypothetical protein